MTTKRSTDGRLRNELGQYADDHAEPGTTLTARTTPNRGAYAVLIDMDEARTIVNRAYSIAPGLQGSAAAMSMLTCIAATSAKVAAADDQDRAQVLVSVREKMDMSGFDEATAAQGFIADTAAKTLSDILTNTVAPGGAFLNTSEEEYEEAVRRELPILSDDDVAQAVSDFSHQPQGFRRSNLAVFAMMGERGTWVASQTKRIPAPVEYPFLSVPPTATIAAIDAMLMHDFEDTNPEEIAMVLSYLRWGSVFLTAAVKDRIGQLRPELLDS